jgi:benzylsuccinate CoA-transferase BbsF subunit
LLADAGADVVKLESRGHIDVHRRAGPYSGGRTDIDSSAVWNAQNRGKRSVALNLKHTEGARIAAELVNRANVVIDNFRPGVLAKLGFTIQSMMFRNPMLVGVSISGFGLADDWRNYPAYGPTMDAVAGLAAGTADREGRPQAVNGWLPDVSASLYAATAIANGLQRVELTGQGCWYDVDELNSTLGLTPEQATVESEQVADLHGNDIRSNRFANGDFCLVCPCRGDDEWVAIRVSRAPGSAKKIVEALRAHLDVRNSVCDDEIYAIDHIVAEFAKEEVAEALQRGGLEAVAVNAASDLLADSELEARGSFVVQSLSNGDTLKSYGSVIRWEHSSRQGRAAPAFGHDNFDVLTEWLGMSPDEIRNLQVQDKVFW